MNFTFKTETTVLLHRMLDLVFRTIQPKDRKNLNIKIGFNTFTLRWEEIDLIKEVMDVIGQPFGNDFNSFNIPIKTIKLLTTMFNAIERASQKLVGVVVYKLIIEGREYFLTQSEYETILSLYKQFRDSLPADKKDDKKK